MTKMPKDMATALDCAIRDCEVQNDKSKYGYIIKGKNEPYDNYISNECWKSFLNEMPKEYKKQFQNGNGGELNEKKIRGGRLVPPKMASFGSSSRFIYELSKDIEGFIYEEQLDTRVGGIANLDGFLHKGNMYVYVEAKRREIYGGTYENEKIKSVYWSVYKHIADNCKEFTFDSESCKDEDGEEMKITFKINSKPVKYFDLKQLICHFLGITYDLAKHNIQNAEVKFLYLIYNPEDVQNNIDSKYREKVLKRYDEVVKFINDNISTINEIFKFILEKQSETHKFQTPTIKFEFKLVDQDTYKDNFK